MTVDPRLLNLSVYINEHLPGDLSLTTLAARMNLSPFHFHRKFRDYFGESLHQHVKRLRLERASYELLHRLRPIKTIALSSGYRTVSAFSHAFSSYAGVSPTTWRETVAETNRIKGRKALARKFGEDYLQRLKPLRVAELEKRDLVFLRLGGNGRVTQTEMWGTVSQLGNATECYAATIDLPGITEATLFRWDIGIETQQMPMRQRNRFGQQTLPGGRYAIFELHCAHNELADLNQAIELFWMAHNGEKPRLGPRYVSYRSSPAGREVDYRLYIPLQEKG